MNSPGLQLVFLGAVIAAVILSGCVSPATTGTPAKNPPAIQNPPPLDVNSYVQMASGSGTGKIVAVTVSPDKSGIIWQGGPDLPAIVSWEAKLSDGSFLAGGSVAPAAGQFDGFGEDIQGKYLIVTARFSDGYEEVILSTRV